MHDIGYDRGWVGSLGRATNVLMLTSRLSRAEPTASASMLTDESFRDSSICRVLRFCKSKIDSGLQSHSINLKSLVKVFETVNFSSWSRVVGGLWGRSEVPQRPSEMSRREMEVKEVEVPANTALNSGRLQSRSHPSIRRLVMVGRRSMVLMALRK